MSKNKINELMKQETESSKKLKEEISNVVNTYNIYQSYKSKNILPLWNKIMAFYTGEVFDKMKDSFPELKIKIDVNFFEEYVSALNNSVYSGSYIGEVTSTTIESDDIVSLINGALEVLSKKKQLKKKYIHKGTWTSLLNIGIKKWFKNDKGDPDFEIINPFNIYLDNSTTEPEKGQAIFIEKVVNKRVLENDKRWGEKAKKYFKDNEFSTPDIDTTNVYEVNKNNQSIQKDNASLLEAYYRNEEGGIDLYYILDKKECILKIDNIEPNCFPFTFLYDQIPLEDPYGKSILAKTMGIVFAIVLLNSIEASHVKKIENAPIFFDLRSKINARSLKDYFTGTDVNPIFPMFGDPQHSIFRQDVQQLPDLNPIIARLENYWRNITGVDLAYKGRTTNSLQTTGATDMFQARVTMLTDNQKIVNLECDAEADAEMYIKFLCACGSKVKVAKRGEYTNKVRRMEEIEFSKDKIKFSNPNTIKSQTKESLAEIKPDELEFVIDAIPQLPMSKRQLFDILKELYEMQGQYQFQVPLVYEEDMVEAMPISAVHKLRLKQRILRDTLVTDKEKRNISIANFQIYFNKFKNAKNPQTGAPMYNEEEAATNALNMLDQDAYQKTQDPTLGLNMDQIESEQGTPVL